MSSPFSIRPARESDIPAIAGLLDALNQFEGYHAITDEAALKAALFSKSRAVNLSALVAVRGERPIAAALYYPGYDTLSASIGYHLADIVVEASCRRQGVGSALLRALAAEALTGGSAWLSLTVLKRNTTAKRFYESLEMQSVDVDFYALGQRGLARL